MRIIKEGNQDERQLVCKHCDSVLGILEKDILWKNDTNLQGEYVPYVECPVCGKKIEYVYFRELPKVEIEKKPVHNRAKKTQK